MRIRGGISKTRVNKPTIGIFRANSIKFAMNNAAIKPQTTSGLFENNNGPGVMLSDINTASNTAVVPEPGTPSANIGTNAPPAAALLPASGAATPLGSPVPNVFSLSTSRFSIEYEMNDPSEAPAPGSTPARKPKNDVRNIVGVHFFNIASGGVRRPI